MSQPATLAWFARHELSLFWRDWTATIGGGGVGGKAGRKMVLPIVSVAFLILVHLLAYAVIVPLPEGGAVPDKMTLSLVTGTAVLSWALMFAQALESVTRAFYARADLDLLLSSPTSSRRIFAVRIAAMAFSNTLLTTALAGPFINVLAVFDGPGWFAGYGVLLAMGALSTAISVILNAAMFRIVGPKRTRVVSQIVAAIVAAVFVIGVQGAAVLSTGSLSRLSLFRSRSFLDMVPDVTSHAWWFAHAIMGDIAILGALLAISLGLLGLVIAIFSGKFAEHVGTVFNAGHRALPVPYLLSRFRTGSTRRVLIRKELILLRRDPWLLSQTLMQIFYLLPPILLLWLNFGGGTGAILILVPALVMASGQLAGGLAWLAVAGEDAPDLVATAPISARTIVIAKIEAVLGSVAVVVAPLVLALGLASPKLALVAAVGIVVAASTGTMIQFWFRGQARHTGLNKRQIPSRLATLVEALSSILWAITAALAALGSPLAGATGGIALLALAGVWLIRPRREVAA